MKLRTMKFRVVAAVAGLALTAATAGCGGGGGDSSGSSGGDASDVTLTYWASNQGTSLDNDKEVLTPVLADFTKQSGVKVNLEVISWNDLQTRIQTAITSGQGPDVLNIGNTWGVSLQATGGLMEFGDQELQAIGGADKFVAPALATGGAPNTAPTSVPLYGLAYGLYYNKAMFAKAGLTPPQTWEEMVAAAEKLTKPDEGVYGMSLAAGSYTENNHFAFINASQNGAEVFDAGGKPTFTTDGMVKGIKRYLDLMATDKVVNKSDSQYENGVKSVAAFANKKAAMIINQNNADSTIEANGMKPSEFGVVPFPAPKDAPTKVASHTAGINLAVMKETKHKDQALQFVKYMTSPEVQAKLGKPFASLPVLKGAKATFTSNPAELKTFTDVYANRSKPLPLVPSEDQFESTVGQAMNAMFAKIATGGNVSEDDIRTAMQSAQESIR
jgi:multiple sugar transport system substrate-binding protein